MLNTEKSVVERERVFSSKTRLRRYADFQYIRRHGESAVGRFCVIRVVDPAPDGCRRVAFVISRHYSKKAVIRNRARRLFREQFRLLAPRLNNCWIEFRPRAFMLRDVKFQDVAPEIERLLEMLGVLQTQPGEADG